MKVTNLFLWFLALVVPGMILVLTIVGESPVVILPGYSEAVFVCGESLTVNAGHEEDPEVQELIKLAHKTCK